MYRWNISGKCHLVGDDDHGRIFVCQFFDYSQDFPGELWVKFFRNAG